MAAAGRQERLTGWASCPNVGAMAVSPAERVHRSSWLWPTVALAVAAAAFFPSVLFGDDFFFCRDGATLHTSMWTVLKARLAAGELPLWFPYDGLGEPFLASGLSALFHPMGLALWLLPVAEAMRWTMLA